MTDSPQQCLSCGEPLPSEEEVSSKTVPLCEKCGAFRNPRGITFQAKGTSSEAAAKDPPCQLD